MDGRPVAGQIASFVVALELDYVRVPAMRHCCRGPVNRCWAVRRGVHVVPVHTLERKREMHQTLIEMNLWAVPREVHVVPVHSGTLTQVMCHC